MNFPYGPFSFTITLQKTNDTVKIVDDGIAWPREVCREKTPKLYLVKDNGKIVYVGVTSERLRKRLSYGLDPGSRRQRGYHGYKWNILERAELMVWTFDPFPQGISDEDKDEIIEQVECIEGELAYLIRKFTGRWPEFQHEIHFHNIAQTQIRIAERIFTEAGGVMI